MNKITKITERDEWELKNFFRPFEQHKIAIFNVHLTNDQTFKCYMRPYILFTTGDLNLYRLDNNLRVCNEWIKSISVKTKPLEPIEIVTKNNKLEFHEINGIKYFKLNYACLTLEEMFGVSEGEFIPGFKSKFINYDSQFFQVEDAQGYQVIKFSMRRMSGKNAPTDSYNVPAVQLKDSTQMQALINVNIYEQSIESAEILHRLKRTPNKLHVLQIIANALIFGIYKQTPKQSNNRRLLILEATEVFNTITKQAKLSEFGNIFHILLEENNLA